MSSFYCTGRRRDSRALCIKQELWCLGCSHPGGCKQSRLHGFPWALGHPAASLLPLQSGSPGTCIPLWILPDAPPEFPSPAPLELTRGAAPSCQRCCCQSVTTNSIFSLLSFYVLGKLSVECQPGTQHLP